MNRITYEDLLKANEGLKTTPIEKRDKKTGKLKSKPYVEVPERVKAFRKVYPDGFITCHIESHENGTVIMRADCGYYTDEGIMVVVGSGTAYETENSTYINKTSYIENCETSAVGRALGFAGFGIDGGIASAEEVQNAITNQERMEAEADPKITEDELKNLRGYADELGVSAAEICQKYGVESLAELTKRQHADAVRILNNTADKLAKKRGGKNE